FCHRTTLRLCLSQVFAFCNRLCLRDISSHVVDDHLRKLPVLCCIDGKLELAVLDLEFCRNRSPLRCGSRQSLLQRNFGICHAFDQSMIAAVLCITLVAHWAYRNARDDCEK